MWMHENHRLVRVVRCFRNAPSHVVMFLIRGYQQVISPLFPSTCRFVPTCSQYALEAVGRYGAMKGGWLALKRILRCQPFHNGGYDPVP